MTALYKKISKQLLDQIQAGEIQVGERLSPEAEVASQLGVSRSTVRLAFSELESVGVLSRRKRTGTTVIAQSPQSHFSMATRTVQQLLALGRDTSLEVLRVSSVNTGDIAELANVVSTNDVWLEILGTRTLIDEPAPFSINRLYVPSKYASIESQLSNETTSIFQLIEKSFDVLVSRVKQTTRAVSVDETEAEMLRVEKYSPALRIDAHLFVRDGTLLEVSVATFAADRFQIDTDVEI